MPMGNMGGMNMNAMLKQAQKIQADMEKIKAELEEKEYEGASGGGAVKITVSGKKQLTGVFIEPEVLEEDADMLSDMIITAANTALRAAIDDYDQQMNRLTGGRMQGML